MPSILHEAVVSFITESVLQRISRMFLDCIPNSEDLLICNSYLNLTVDSGTQDFIPDCIHLVDTIDPCGSYSTVLLEVGFTHQATLLHHLKKLVAEYPETLMVIVITIDESQPYRTPSPSSGAWQMLSREAHIRPMTSFQSAQGRVTQLCDILVAGHCWCSIQSVQFQVWVKGNEPIDIDCQDSTLTARGELHPSIDMEDVMSMMRKGFTMMKDRYQQLATLVNPNIDLAALHAAEITVPFSSERLLRNLAHSCVLMAYKRYRDWYCGLPKAAPNGSPSIGRGGRL